MTKVGNNNIHKILVDNKSAADILYLNAFNRIRLSEEYLRLVTTSLYGFKRDSLMPREKISLLVIVGKHP